MNVILKLCCLSLVIFVCFISAAGSADTILDHDEVFGNYPSVASEGNLPNCGHIVSDGHHLYAYWNNKHGTIVHINDNLYPDYTVMDDVVSDGRGSYFNGWMYFCGRTNRNPGLFRIKLTNGYSSGASEKILKGNILAYAIDENGIYYAKANEKGIYRATHEGSNVEKIANHSIRMKNNVVRMMTYAGNLYYVNDEDHKLYRVPCDGSEKTQKVGEVSIHYFIITVFNKKPVIIYSHFASTNEKLNSVRMGSMDLDGNDIPELAYLSSIQSRYFNCMSGWMYYADSERDKSLRRLKLDKGLESAETLVRNPVGYIDAFNGWVTAVDIDRCNYHFFELDTGAHYTILLME